MFFTALVNSIDQLVFAYDGMADSIYAIKQFTYLFPELRDTRIVVVSINPAKIETEERSKFREWLHSVFFGWWRFKGYIDGGIASKTESIFHYWRL